MSDLKPAITSRPRFSPIWVIPMTALLVGLWMLATVKLEEGPTITIRFDTAEGLVEGKTTVKLLQVDIGLVVDVDLNEDKTGIIATVELSDDATSLLREDTLFWVVRARIGSDNISGIGTILSGAYIEIAPGQNEQERSDFIGLELPPLTPVGTPGLRLSLYADLGSSIAPGNPVLFNGYKVGRVEAMKFDKERTQIRYQVFIEELYTDLVTSSVRFWNISGVSLEASAQGIEVNTGSLETILLGGVSFATPEGLPEGEKVEDGTEFKLYRNHAAMVEQPYRYRIQYVLLFDQSLRGLVVGAPVEFRGIQIGKVNRILVSEVLNPEIQGDNTVIPVLISLAPGRLALGDNPQAVETLKSLIQNNVSRGLRATLASGNLLTGSLYVNIDFFENAEQASLGKFDMFMTMPTISGGLGRIEQQVSALLEKLNSLPVEQTVKSANQALAKADESFASMQSTLVSLKSLLVSMDGILNQEENRQLGQKLSRTLAELREVLSGFSQDGPVYRTLDSSLNELNKTLGNLEEFTRTLSDNPNALVLPTELPEDPIPGAKP